MNDLCTLCILPLLIAAVCSQQDGERKPAHHCFFRSLQAKTAAHLCREESKSFLMIFQNKAERDGVFLELHSPFSGEFLGVISSGHAASL